MQTPFLSLPYLDGVINGRTGIPLKAWKAEQIRKGVYAILREENVTVKAEGGWTDMGQ